MGCFPYDRNFRKVTFPRDGFLAAFRQAPLPLAFAFVHAQINRGVARWVVSGWFDKEKIGSPMRDPDGHTIDDQSHLYLGGMCAVTLVRNHDRLYSIRKKSSR